MPRALKVCATPGCFEVQPCPEHAPPAWQGSRRAARLPSNWAKVRKQILRRDPLCYLCGENPATEVDHIVAGDDHSESNLAGICRGCHRFKSSREGLWARQAGKGRHGWDGSGSEE